MLRLNAGLSALSGNSFCMLCVLRQMAGPHWSGTNHIATPLAHKHLPGEIHDFTLERLIEVPLIDIKKGFNKNKQEDTHEFFRFVTDALQNSALAAVPST